MVVTLKIEYYEEIPIYIDFSRRGIHIV
jgi:hypothetical protein